MFKNRIFSLLALFACVLTLSGQAPAWLDESYRSSAFPASDYFCGFAAISPDLDAEPARAAHTEALKRLAESVFADVNVVTKSSIGSTAHNGSYDEYDLFSRDMSVSSAVGIAGMNTDTWMDSATGTAYEFARVSRNSLREYYDRMMAATISDAHHSLDIAEQSNADKSVLQKQAEAIAEGIATARRHAKVLTAIDAAAAEAHTAGLHSADSRLAALTEALSRGILVYIAPGPDKASAQVISKLKAELTESGCTFADTPETADYVLSLSAGTELMSVYDDVFHVNANVDLSLTNRRKGVKVYEDAVSTKGSALAQKQAEKKALNQSAAKIKELINKHIQ
ncbi:MAG: hypothetical protein NC418_00730 [Muribaculaceae bacterium]|nr:hypothetical protein [Muribaculaceae bacterium]